jgi:two-component system sensor histidine kinase ResE
MKLMGDISHELNTPLAAIRVNTEAILDGVVSGEEDKTKKLNSILNQTKRLSYLVDDLLELAKFETGEVSLVTEPFLIMETVSRAVETSEILAQKKNDRIIIDSENENLKALGDARRITQVITNLVNNAIHHNPEGIEIKITVSESPTQVTVSVEDSGTGIPKEELEDIFRRFHKVDRSRTRRESGSGLGLAIVKEIIESHNTTIKVESEESKGTKFTFSLNKSKG